MKDYYAILDVAPDASVDAIRKAFRSLAFVYHPDIAGDDAVAAATFIELREAYETLIRDDSRRSYDSERAAHLQAEMERRAAAQRVRVERATARQAYSPRFTEQRLRTPFDAELLSELPSRRPHDVYGSVEVALEETLRPGCITVVLPEQEGEPPRKVLVRLPGKLYSGATLRVTEQGEASVSGRGDLLIDVVLAQHPQFRLCADNLFYDLVVRPWHAALGFEATVPTLDGNERLPVPPLLSTPQMRRLPGKGIYKRNGERGDLWVNLKLEVPPPTSYRARRLWAELAEEYRHQKPN